VAMAATASERKLDEMVMVQAPQVRRSPNRQAASNQTGTV